MSGRLRFLLGFPRPWVIPPAHGHPKGPRPVVRSPRAGRKPWRRLLPRLAGGPRRITRSGYPR